MGVINRKERFATEGFRIGRHNGDGTKPTPQRFLGFANMADLSKALNTSKKANLTIKIDHRQPETKLVDFSDVAVLSEVSVMEAVDALENAEFTGISWDADEKTGRLVGSADSGAVVQVTGKLAAALDFGQSAKFGGNGLEVISFFGDETISIGLPKDIKDKEEIDVEGSKGTITRMIIGAMLQGLSPVITLKQKDYYLLEMIQGGKLDREEGTYDPPLSNESEHPSFWIEIFSAIYSEGSNKMSDVAGYERLLLRTLTGIESDVPIEAKSWAQYAFNLSATEYTDEFGDRYPAYQEQTLTQEEFDALRVKEISIKE
jgi:hypothetical protein